MYLCIIYGIVIIEIYSCNKELYTLKVTWFFSLILPKHAKTREPKDKCCALWCANIHIYMQHLTPRQPQDSFTHSTAIHNMGAHPGSQK